MWNINKGFSLVGLIITIGVIIFAVFAIRQYGKDGNKNQIQAGQEAIDQANDAANLQNENTMNLQGELQDPPGVNYDSVRNKLKGIDQ